MSAWPTVRVLREVGDERARQDAKWGEQNPPDGTGGTGRSVAAIYAKRDTDRAAAAGRLTWRHIFDEEVLEAFAEDDETLLRAELIQSAAVAVAWVEAIDRRSAVVATDNPCDARLTFAPGLTLNQSRICTKQLPLKCATAAATASTSTYLCGQSMPCAIHGAA